MDDPALARFPWLVDKDAVHRVPASELQKAILASIEESMAWDLDFIAGWLAAYEPKPVFGKKGGVKP